MPTQLAFEFSFKPAPDKPSFTSPAWHDVSDIARGVGFTEAVQVSPALKDALEYQQDDYDQLLYDALWLAHFKLSLDDLTGASFNFSGDQKDCESQGASGVSLQLRIETHEEMVRLGLLEDF